jgi:membrane-bound lytic murein transglycosylase D
MNKPVILAAGTPQVLLPYNNATLFVRNLQEHRAPLATWTAWVSPATLKPGDVARQVGMTEPDLRAVNRIPPNMLVKVGSTLLVPRSPHKTADVSEHVADNATMLLAPDRPSGKRVAFKAGKGGDSVVAVAKRYRVSVAQVAQWNDVDADSRFKPGQTIVVMQPVSTKAARASAGGASSRPATAKTPVQRAALAKPAAKPTAKVAVSKPNSKL